MSPMKKSNHIRLKLLGLIALILLAIPSCVSELDSISFSFERLVVVDGVFTDEEKIQTVRLSYTTPVGLDSLAPLKGARVWVEDDLGTIVNFIEQSAGVYSTRQVFQGVEGRSYGLVFVTEGGKQYESISEVLVKSPPIEISQRFAELPSTELIQNEEGLQFFIDTPDGAGNAQFFRYEWNDVSRTTVPYPSQVQTEVFIDSGSHYGVEFMRITPQELDLRTCYRFDFSNSLILGTTTGLSENRILDQHVRFASTDRLNFMNRYSIEVIQYATSQRAFNYYKTLKEFNESNGSLFDTQQGLVLGNVKSLDDDEEVVLGYFEVSGVSRQRKFYNPNEFNQEFTAAFVELSDVCKPTNRRIMRDIRPTGATLHSDVGTLEEGTVLPIDFFEEVIFRRVDVPLIGFMIYDIEIRVFYHPNNPFPDFTATLYMAPGICMDCRRHGELVEKPTYWID